MTLCKMTLSGMRCMTSLSKKVLINFSVKFDRFHALILSIMIVSIIVLTVIMLNVILPDSILLNVVIDIIYFYLTNKLESLSRTDTYVLVQCL
jgi:hypothetical protein